MLTSRVAATLLALLFVLGFSAAAYADKRVALVVGNATYVNVPALQNPENDASSIAAMLKDFGFEITSARNNLGLSAFKRALADFEVRARDADVAVLYFSGHGLQVDGEDFLVPVDAELTRDVDVDDETVSLARVERTVAGAKQLGLILLDACRDNPFVAKLKGSSATRSVNRGLAPVQAASSGNLLVAFSAAPGEQAQDGPPSGHSPFTDALLRRFRSPGLDVQLALRAVRDDVTRSTDGKQRPYMTGTMGSGVVALAPADAPPAKPAGEPDAFESYSDLRLCRRALATGGHAWSDGASGAVREADTRGLSVDDCRHVLGLRDEPVNPFAELSDKAICVDGFDAGQGVFGERYAAEAGRRKLTADACRQALGVATDGGALHEVSEMVLCRVALNHDRSGWVDDAPHAPFVAEAVRRDLTVEVCRKKLGLTQVAPKPTTASDLSGLSKETLCRNALGGDLVDWDRSNSYAAHVAEAQRRGLSILDCRDLLTGSESQTTATTPALSDLSKNVLCRDALRADLSDWDPDAYPPHIAEAKRRGLSVVDCRNSLVHSVSQTPHPASPLNDLSNEVLCRSALRGDRAAWDFSHAYIAQVEEAQRRGLSVADCRNSLAIYGGQTSDPASPLSDLSNEALCRSALRGDRAAWDLSNSYVAQVAEAKRRGLRVADCRRVLAATR